MKKIMVVIDATESSFHALMWVLENLSEEIESSKLVVFAAQPIPLPVHHTPAQLAHAQLYCPTSASTELVLIAQEQNRKVSQGLLEKARIICGRRGIKIEAVTEAGDPKETICRAVQKHEIRLLAISEKRVGILERVFQGDVAKYCIEKAKCSVLVVKKEP